MSDQVRLAVFRPTGTVLNESGPDTLLSETLPSPAALSFKQLCLLFDCKQATTLERLLKKRGIRWSTDRRGRPWTTAAQLERVFAPKARVAEPNLEACSRASLGKAARRRKKEGPPVT